MSGPFQSGGDARDRGLQALLEALAGPASSRARDQLLGALRSTGLLGAGEELAALLEAFAAADGEERRRILRELLRLQPAAPGQPQASDQPQGAGALHPLLEGLLRQLPPPGHSWTGAERQRWLDLAALIVDSLFRVEPEPRSHPGD